MGANPQVSVTSLSDLDATMASFRRHMEAPPADLVAGTTPRSPCRELTTMASSGPTASRNVERRARP